MSSAKRPVLELRSLDKATHPPARVIENPWWNEIDSAIEKCHKNDGFVYLRVLLPKNKYVQKLSLNSLSGVFRLIAITNDEDPKRHLLEWWDPDIFECNEKIKFDEDEWDSRTISKDWPAVHKIFLELYENGDLGRDTLKDMRSQWDPKPK